MNATPAAAALSSSPSSSARAWARELAEQPKPAERAVSCGCGLVVKSSRSRATFASFLANVGWTATKGRLSCPECTAGVVRRVVTGSKGDRYVLRHIGSAWRCSCPGYTYRGRCTHAESLEKETKERARLSGLARDFLKEAEPGDTVYPADFLAWLGKEARQVTVESYRIVLASVLEDYRHVCRECDGTGAETEHTSGWHEPVLEGDRCSHCDGDGQLDPPRLASLQDAMPIAAE